MRMRVDDWNDGLIYTWAQKAFKECVETSESVLNSAMAAWVFDEYARLLDYADPNSMLAKEVRANADHHREATRAQWNGRWFKRAWLGPNAGLARRHNVVDRAAAMGNSGRRDYGRAGSRTRRKPSTTCFDRSH